MKIIALGDSLTEGFQIGPDFSFPLQSTPYTDHLRNLALEYLDKRKANIDLEILNMGVCGDSTYHILMRLQRDVLAHRPDHVIILGGTNDIGIGITPNQAFNNLKNIYDTVENNNINPVACTIPSILGFDELIRPRLELNELIRKEAERRAIPLIDVFKATSDPETNRLMEKYSSDGLHLNVKGYQRIGELVFNSWLRGVLDSHLK